MIWRYYTLDKKHITESKKDFKEWLKEFLSANMKVKPSDVWTLDLIAETIAMKYEMDMEFVWDNK